MSDDEKGLIFDFEDSLEPPPPPVPTVQPSPETDVAGAGNPESYRTVVCKFWLRSKCMHGDSCRFLHENDKSRLPICENIRRFGECGEKDCVLKHSDGDVEECSMYKMGFCPNGPNCRDRHVKRPGPPPPVKQVMQKIYAEDTEKSQFQQGTTSTTNVDKNSRIQQAQTKARTNAIPLPEGSSRYFVVKSYNQDNLVLSVEQGVWATRRVNEAKLSEAFGSVDNVILIFSVYGSRHFQGCARMTSAVGDHVVRNWNGTAGASFAVKWLKLCELVSYKTDHLKNLYNNNKPVKMSIDCQELEPSVGKQLASLLYHELDSYLMAISIAAESKREEEKAKLGNLVNNDDNPDFTPVEENEEEEEEEIVSFGQAQGRGSGREMMWPSPYLSLAHGVQPFSAGFFGFPLDASGFPWTAGSGMMFPAWPPGGYGMMVGHGRAPFMAGMDPGQARSRRPVGMPPFYSSHGEGAYQKEDHYSSGTGNIYRNDESESEDEAPRKSRHDERKKKKHDQ